MKANINAREAYAITLAAVPHYLFLLPAIAGGAWLITLSTMLIYWVALGRPVFPGQANPLVPYISEIAAWHLKPFFITGCSIVSVTFIASIISIHYARESPRFYGAGVDESSWRRLASAIAMVAGILAGGSLLTLSIMDTVRAHAQHETSLMVVFGGLAIAAMCTAAVWADVWMGGDEREKAKSGGQAKWLARLRIWGAINFALMIIISGLTVAFMAMNFSLLPANWRNAAILEWIITYCGSFWLLTFVGFLLRMAQDDEKDLSDIEEEVHAHEGERRPLLSDP